MSRISSLLLVLLFFIWWSDSVAQKNTAKPKVTPPTKKITQPATIESLTGSGTELAAEQNAASLGVSPNSDAQPPKPPHSLSAHKKNTGCAPNEALVYEPNATKPPLLTCTKISATTPCKETEDLLLDLPYPHQWGRVLIPKEARCGGAFDLVLLLHGVILPPKAPSLMLGGGATEKDRYLEKTVRALLDEKKIAPVIVADPTDIGTSCQLYDKKDFDFLAYFDDLHALLAEHNVRVRSISAAGHSGSACCTSAGMFRIVEAFPELKIWGSVDSCYGNSSYAKFIKEKLPEATTMFTLTRTGKFDGSSYIKEVLGASPEEVRCDKKFDACQKHPTKPRYIFQTRAKNHHYLPEPYLAEMLERFFPI